MGPLHIARIPPHVRSCPPQQHRKVITMRSDTVFKSDSAIHLLIWVPKTWQRHLFQCRKAVWSRLTCFVTAWAIPQVKLLSYLVSLVTHKMQSAAIMGVT